MTLLSCQIGLRRHSALLRIVPLITSTVIWEDFPLENDNYNHTTALFIFIYIVHGLIHVAYYCTFILRTVYVMLQLH